MTGKPHSNQAKFNNLASPYHSSSLPTKTPEQRAREYRARHKFNFLNSVTRHENDFLGGWA